MTSRSALGSKRPLRRPNWAPAVEVGNRRRRRPRNRATFRGPEGSVNGFKRPTAFGLPSDAAPFTRRQGGKGVSGREPGAGSRPTAASSPRDGRRARPRRAETRRGSAKELSCDCWRGRERRGRSQRARRTSGSRNGCARSPRASPRETRQKRNERAAPLGESGRPGSDHPRGDDSEKQAPEVERARVSETRQGIGDQI